MATATSFDQARQRIAVALDKLEAAIARRESTQAQALRAENATLRARYDVLEAHARAALTELDRLLDNKVP